MEKPNINFISNIYILKKQLNKDWEFLRKVQGIQPLKKVREGTDLNQYVGFTKDQMDELENGAHCSSNAEDDYTSGRILKDGKVTWGCRCIKTDCINFEKCRDDFNVSELECLTNNLKQDYTQQDYDIEGHLPKEWKETEIDKNIQPKSEIIIEEKEDISSQVKIEQLVFSEILEKPVQMENRVVENRDWMFLGFPMGMSIDNKPNVDDTEIKGKKQITIVNDQQSVIKALPNDKILVNAGPGTGKTYTLIERLKYLADECEIDPYDEMLVLCFSRSAVSEIKRRLRDAIQKGEISDRLNSIDIRTFDSFATYLISYANEDIDLSEKDYSERINMAIDEIKKYPEAFGSMKHFIVDEIQDLVGERAELVQTILTNLDYGFTLLGDSCQSIYEYQVEDKETQITSVDFYNWLNEYYKDELIRAEFNINHRQTPDIADTTGRLRKYMLDGTLDSQKNELQDILDEIKDEFICSDIPTDIFKGQSIGFLCRTNGDALKVSSYLSNAGIEHSLQKPLVNKSLVDWLGKLFSELSTDVIDYESFAEFYLKCVRNVGQEKVLEQWANLKFIEAGSSSRLRVSQLIKNIYKEKYANDNLCITDSSNIVVSTIHRAKGKEFDEIVIVKNDDAEKYSEQNGEDDIANEIKTYYVALTRPKRKLYKGSFRKTFVYKVKSTSDRWVERGYNRLRKNKYISHIEVGKEKDIDRYSFVNLDIFAGSEEKVRENQEYIRTKVKKSDEVSLYKTNFDGKEVYMISHSGKTIGSLTPSFSYEVKNSLKEVQGFFFELPEEITEVRVDNIVSFIEMDTSKNIGNIYKQNRIWNGITLSGFGRIVWNKYD